MLVGSKNLDDLLESLKCGKAVDFARIDDLRHDFYQIIEELWNATFISESTVKRVEVNCRRRVGIGLNRPNLMVMF